MEKETLNNSVLSHGEWEDLVIAAESAGRQSARELAQRCTPWELGRTGQVWVRVQPDDSPVAMWLRSTGRSNTEIGHPDEQGALVAITPTVRDLAPANSPVSKARSLLVRRAYAEAYCTVLVQEAGVIAEVLTLPDQFPARESRSGTAESRP
ncbi:hypothetical protein DFQ14_104188 [Halopolyspora algeriensis]|uniref:Uncharacterized protein n=1 Tax=Halopolyspora algeriensis TaxID=1500506 RepID=A0A368VSB9_9ACTN|nr:hypothetical protein [Halopolyspora algeriensis]RCW44599.1 hypothetical protein DFQ14_104188 [Halopolyspora algeriensis]TQM55960.1 hypothetical protein FHU43_0738 [Halopolyspora algeriensis]